MSNHHDVLIIGGGTGGLRTAIISAKSGFDTGLVEPGAIGGTCLNTGCIPTKTILHAADVYREMQDCGELGLQVDNVSFEFSDVMGRMRDIVTKGRTHAEESVERIDNITHYDGEAGFVNDSTVSVDGEEVSADKIIISTGASPWAPPIEGLEDTGYMTNVEALELEEKPESMLMIGGGYIACEFATFFASLGIDVQILEVAPNILGMLDDDVREVVRSSLEGLGVDINTGKEITRVEGENGKSVKATVSDGKEYEAEYLMVCTGRRPNTKGLNLDAAGVELDDNGNVEVDELLRTSQSHIYAIGDVNGKAPFAHTAKREARAVLENALLNHENTIRHDIIPWAVFTHPTVGGVGMSEEQALQGEHEVGIMKGEFRKVGKARIIRETDGFVKVIYDKGSREVLGSVIVGPDAHNLIHEVSTLMNTPEPKVDYLKKSIHVHPTLAEVMEELKEA